MSSGARAEEPHLRRRRIITAAIRELAKDEQDALGLWCFELQPGLFQIARHDPEDGIRVVSRVDHSGDLVGLFHAIPQDEADLIYDRDSGYGNRDQAETETAEIFDLLASELSRRGVFREIVTQTTTFDWGDSWLKTTIEIDFTPHRFGEFDHIEFRVIRPDKHPIPISNSGYRSHVVPSGTFLDLDHVVESAKRWLDEMSESPSWRERIRNESQLDMFGGRNP